jgi:hypothetical protein
VQWRAAVYDQDVIGQGNLRGRAAIRRGAVTSWPDRGLIGSGARAA